MQEIEDDEGAHKKILVCIWYEDIAQEVVENEVESRIGLTKEALDTDLEMPSEEILTEIVNLSEESEELLRTDDLQSEMELYLNETKDARTHERKLIKEYSKTKREVSKELFERKSKALIANLGILEEDIIFMSEYSPFIIMEAEKELIELMDNEEVIVSIDLLEENNDIYTEEVNSIVNNETVSELYNTMSGMKEVNGYDEIFLKTGLSGEGVVLGMIEQCAPSKELDFTGEVDESKYYYFSTNPPTDEHATNTATIICGTESLSYNVNRLYCASMECDEYIGRDVSNFCQGMDDLVKAGVHVINCSTGIGGTTRSDDEYSVLEEWLDYMAYRYDLVFVQAAGNYAHLGDPINVPGLSYNVITVGFLDDLKTESKNDDVLYAGSCYDNGDGCAKPDVVITGSFMKGGTSSAAPLIVSIIALMLELKPSLEVHPQVIKAILLASCHRKVLDPVTGTQTELMTEGLTEKQGAGVVDPMTALCIVANKQYGERELGFYEDYIQVVQPKYDSTYMNVSVAWYRQFPELTEDPTINTVPTGATCDIELHVYDALNYNVGASLNSNSSTEMTYFPLFNNVNEYTIEISKYVTSSEAVTYGYAWSTDNMEYQVPTEEGIYYIQNKLSKHYLDVDEEGYLFQNDFLAKDSQQWVVRNETNEGEFRIRNDAYSGYVGLGSTGPVNPKMISTGFSRIVLTENEDCSISLNIYPPNNENGYALQPIDDALLIGAKMKWVSPPESKDSQSWYFQRINYRKGDINEDGQLNTDDLTSLENCILNSTEYKQSQRFLSDVNSDGSINNEDIECLTVILQ